MKKIYWIIVIIVVLAIAAIVYFAGMSRKAVAPSAPSTVSSTTVNASTSSAAGAATASTGTSASSAPVVQSAYFSDRTSSSLGTYLTDGHGMTLYTFGHDTPGVSNCTGVCLTKWHPYGPGISASGTYNLPMLPVNVGTIKGNNGMVQFTWKGMPLYYYYLDKTPGQTLGEGVLNAWYVVKI
jgi:predicted lipoprotein with Yx(FWY)xxD motif